MIRHHLRLALRAFVWDKTSVLLGGLSLAVALAACVLIALFVVDEVSYDRAIPNSERISLIGTESTFAGETSSDISTPNLLSGALRESVPSVESSTLTFGRGGKVPVLGRAGQPEHELGFVFGDSAFFDVFAYPFLAGDRETALDAPDAAVLTASGAKRLYGNLAPIGEPLRLAYSRDTLNLTVRGVIPDPIEPTSLTFEAVLAFGAWRAQNPDVGTGWGSRMYNTYALRKPGADPAALQAAMDRGTASGEWGQREIRYLDVPLRDLRLSEFSYVPEGFGGDGSLVRLFSAVALIILLLGAINYVNLATARGARRAKEIGVRKALGSDRSGLIRQFLTESVLLTLLASGVGVALAALALPFFNQTFGTELALGDLGGRFALGLSLSVVAIGLVAGVYPALYLSRFDAVRVLRGASSSAQVTGEAFLSRTWLRRGLVAFQFTAAVLLLIATASVFRQLDYARSAPLGFEPESVAVIEVDATLRTQPDAVRDALMAVPGVVGVSGASGVPTQYLATMNTAPDPQQPEQQVSFKEVSADPYHADVLGMRLASGRWPAANRPDDLARGVVVNETFADALGWSAADAIGREIEAGMAGMRTIVGVTEDFHFESFREPIGAVSIAPDAVMPWETGHTGPAYPFALVRFESGREAEGLAGVRAALGSLAPEAAFEPEWLSDKYAELYSNEARLVQTFGLFAGIAVLIAALGLVGLAMYTVERRTKEIGIRKVLGASASHLIAMLSREYIVIVAVAVLVASPLAVILVGRWLEDFAYHTPFSPFVLIGAAVAVLLLAVASVGVQAYVAAHRDPIHALRSE